MGKKQKTMMASEKKE